MASEIATFLEDAAGRLFEYGAWDCTLYPADWIRRVTGFDPAASYRGRYADEEGAQALLQAAGGIVALYRRAASEARLTRSPAPSCGAVGLVPADCRDRLIGAVCVAPGFWSTVAPIGGLAVTACRASIAWEIPCLKSSPS